MDHNVIGLVGIITTVILTGFLIGWLMSDDGRPTNERRRWFYVGRQSDE